MTPFSADYGLSLSGNAGKETGTCSIAIEGSGLTVTPKRTAAIPIRFSEIVDWQAEDYAVCLSLADGSVLKISRLARRFDEFVDLFRQTRREYFLKALLLEEEIVSFFEQGSYDRPGSERMISGQCSVYLQKTSLACFPDTELPFLLPYGALTEVSGDSIGYRLSLVTDDEELLLHRFGMQTDNLFNDIEELRSQLAKRQGEAIAALSPETASLTLRRVGQLLRDGVPVERGQLETAAAGVWEGLWTSGFNEERRPYAEYLRDRASSAFVVIKETGEWGTPEGTPPALADRRMLYLFRIGNKIVVETPSADDTATYLFRSDDDTRCIRSLCRALASIQFRREPLYLSLAAMTAPPHDRYAEACRLLPDLVMARSAFAGRAIHLSLESWQRELDELAAK